jgi:hypothetical protein
MGQMGSQPPRWTDGYRTLIGPFSHEQGWRFIIDWAGQLQTPHDFDSWAEAHAAYAELIACWTDPDVVPMADGPFGSVAS